MESHRKMSPYAHFNGRAMVRHILTKLGKSKYMPHVGAKERARHAGRALRQFDTSALDSMEMRLQINERISRASAV